jgi:hypothetical protein
LSEFRKLIHSASDEVTEEKKWNVPTFIYKSKVIFTMAAFKNHVKYNFILNGALLKDEHHIFNNGFESPKSRSVDLTENQNVDLDHLTQLIDQALNKI